MEEEDREGETPRGATVEVIRMGGNLTPPEGNADLPDLLGKHWQDTKGGAPFQCSPESDLDFHVKPNEFHMMVCLGRP